MGRDVLSLAIVDNELILLVSLFPPIARYGEHRGMLREDAMMEYLKIAQGGHVKYKHTFTPQ